MEVLLNVSSASTPCLPWEAGSLLSLLYIGQVFQIKQKH